jgi:plasmid stability protein
VANLQIKNVDDDVYADLKALAASENRSVSQQVLCLVKGYLSRRHHSDHTKTPAEVLLDLSGSWEDDRPPEEIVEELRSHRQDSQRLLEGF